MMSAPDPSNGRPTWRDVLHAVETSEKRVMAAIDGLHTQIGALDVRLDEMEKAETIRMARAQDLRLMGSAARVVVATVASVIALVVSVLTALHII